MDILVSTVVYDLLFSNDLCYRNQSTTNLLGCDGSRCQMVYLLNWNFFGVDWEENVHDDPKKKHYFLKEIIIIIFVSSRIGG